MSPDLDQADTVELLLRFGCGPDVLDDSEWTVDGLPISLVAARAIWNASPEAIDDALALVDLDEALARDQVERLRRLAELLAAPDKLTPQTRAEAVELTADLDLW